MIGAIVCSQQAMTVAVMTARKKRLEAEKRAKNQEKKVDKKSEPCYNKVSNEGGDNNV